MGELAHRPGLAGPFLKLAGRPLPISTFADPTCTGGTCKQEGYVLVTPYWSATAIKVCAFDAQALATAFHDQGSTLARATPRRGRSGAWRRAGA